MSIIDISAPAEPELVGAWVSGHGDIGSPTVGLAVMGGLALVAGKDLVVIDASDPTQPTEIAGVAAMRHQRFESPWASYGVFGSGL